MGGATMSVLFKATDSVDFYYNDSIMGSFSQHGLDLGTSALANITDGATDMIRFDGSHNVEIPNGNLDMGGNNITNEDMAVEGGDTLCWDGSGNSGIGDCSSLRRYKNNISTLGLGLQTVRQLQPRSYTWIDRMGGHRDIGFVAEEVAEVNPLLADYDNETLRGVKYRHYTAVLTNAVQQLDRRNRELQRENGQLRQENREQAEQIEELTDAVCDMNPDADVCH